jgi:iodotyrosine deiodinase
MSSEWTEDLTSLGTDWHKPFLETAPYLIVIFRKIHDLSTDGKKKNNYYVQVSVGLAA